VRRSEREGRFQGEMTEPRENKFSPRPTPRTRKKYPKVGKRLRDRVRNRENYAKKTEAARVEFLALASSAVDKIGGALDAWGLGETQWCVPIMADPGPLGDGTGGSLPRTKEAALLKRATVVHGYLKFQVQSGNSSVLHNQREVSKHHNVSAPLVASWTRDFLRLEPRPLLPAAIGGGVDAASIDHHPLTFSPVNPYTVSPEVMPIVNDAHIRGLATWFVRANANVKGRPNMKASDFQRWVNTFLIPTHLTKLRPFRSKLIHTYNNEWVTPDGALLLLLGPQLSPRPWTRPSPSRTRPGPSPCPRPRSGFPTWASARPSTRRPCTWTATSARTW